MARIQHLAIASRDPFKQAEFYKRVFGFQEVKRLDNPRAKGVVLTDGHLNISVLEFHQDQLDHGLSSHRILPLVRNVWVGGVI